MIGGFLLLIGISLCAAIFMVTRFRPFQDPVRLIRYAGLAYALGFALCLTTGSPPLFFLYGIFTGFAAGFVDTALNSQASQWEQAAGRRAMSFFHALFSLGVLLGAGLVTILLAHDPDGNLRLCHPLWLGDGGAACLGRYSRASQRRTGRGPDSRDQAAIRRDPLSWHCHPAGDLDRRRNH